MLKMSWHRLSLALLCLALRHCYGSVCVAELEDTLQGTCHEAGQESSMHGTDVDKTRIKAEVGCITELVTRGYTLRSSEGHGPKSAFAVPQNASCSNGNFEDKYGPIQLSCVKPFNEFPNSCSGKSVVGEVHFAIAFFAYRKAFPSGPKKVLETAIVLGGNHLYDHPKQFICTGGYTILSGQCLGLAHENPEKKSDSDKDEPPNIPPEPPQVGWMPYPFPMVGYPNTECDATRMDLSKEEEEGEFRCQIDSDFEKCQLECASGFKLKWPTDTSWEMVQAIPDKKECSVKLEDETQRKCPESFVVRCANAFGEFPNACQGYYATSPGQIWISFWAFRRNMGTEFADVLESRIHLNPNSNATCGERYLVNEKGFCLGLPGKAELASGPAIDPPAQPQLFGKDGPFWPPVPDPNFAPEPAPLSGQWPDLMWLVYVLLVLLLLGLVVAAFLARRKRIVEEERRLREAQEVEIPGPGGF